MLTNTTASKRTERIAYLADKITTHRRNYHNATDKNKIISDEAYELFVDELTELDPENKALNDIGAPVEAISEWEKIKHTAPAGSLNKVKTPEAFKEWVLKTFKKGNSMFWSEKLDGLTILLDYEKGELKTASTRGAGIEGENIYNNVIRMRGIKRYIAEEFTGTIRGEVILTKSAFKAFFEEEGYSNERNAAAGIARRYDGKGCEHLSVLCYQATGSERLTSEYLQFQYLEFLGFKTPQYGASSTSNKTEEVIKVWQSYNDGVREKLDYIIDGLVVSINDLDAQKELGVKHLRPEGQIAFKFPSSMACTIIRDIQWQVGSQGHITPVAILDKVDILGVVVERATLCTVGEIKRLGLYKDCKVLVSRRNDVIPKIEEVVE